MSGPFSWLGNVTNDVSVLIVWNAATKARTVDDLTKLITKIANSPPHVTNAAKKIFGKPKKRKKKKKKKKKKKS